MTNNYSGAPPPFWQSKRLIISNICKAELSVENMKGKDDS